MARHGDGETLILLAAVGVGVYLYLQSQGLAPSLVSIGLPTATPLSIYPEFAYTAQTSMAASPTQKTTGQVIPTTAFTAVQGQESAAVLGQCAGSYPGCTVLTADTQLGF